MDSDRGSGLGSRASEDAPGQAGECSGEWERKQEGWGGQERSR